MKMYQINEVDIIDLTQYRRFRLEYGGYAKYYILGYLKNRSGDRSFETEEWEFKNDIIAKKTYKEIVELLTK